jgi:hypothetical protein
MSIGDSRDLPTSESVYLELSDGQSHKFDEQLRDRDFRDVDFYFVCD